MSRTRTLATPTHLLLALAVALGGLLIGAANPASAQVGAATTQAVTPFPERVRVEVNKQRTANRVAALGTSKSAPAAAQSWARQLANADQGLSHQPLRPLMDRNHWSRAGENVAYLGSKDAAQVTRMWMNSSGHRANILNAGYTHTGVGVATARSGRVYVVMLYVASR
ncbi:CAP domain-containing protein [Nocardioides zeae]|uniref:CAP domain-containing protein n=1 Tax=Nocardioides imazamoxiresistens TaxID=3231893 RepID=A0ABU3PRH5_9ACTN|nr:CAP domain-containing protein [Nocardioides zeae]MDT9591818.1 CAP domain-containing protein [Nocardioides zeae]